MRVKSVELMERARAVIPGGVNSPVRAFKAVGDLPPFIARGSGAMVYDEDGNAYIDYVGSWGPLILGHCPENVNAAIAEALSSGTSFGAPTRREVELAELLVGLVPSLEMVRMVNSGTEATMSAIRLARAFTGRDLIIKFNGCYHGHSDGLLVAAGSGAATYGIPGSAGVPEEAAALTLSIEFNDIELLEQTIVEAGSDDIAAVIIEPVPGNMGFVMPKAGYLERVRQLCNRHQIVLIFDEVMSGFRVSLGGAQERFGVQADLVTYGKVIGGGLPVGAFGGRREIMNMLAPLGPVYQAGTLSGNPLAMAAGLETLKTLIKEAPYERLEGLARRLTDGLQAAADACHVPFQASCCGAMFGFFFSEKPVSSYSEAKESNTEAFTRFFKRMLAEGVYLAPSAFEAGFISTAHTPELIDRTIEAAKKAFAEERVSTAH